MAFSDNKLTAMEKYTIYLGYDEVQGRYFVCMPNQISGKCSLFVALPKCELDTASRDEVILEVRDVADIINEINDNAICVIPFISPTEVSEASHENDDRAYKPIFDKLHAVLFDVNNNFGNVNQIINVINREDDDTKFWQWLESSYIGEFFNRISLAQIKEKYYGTTIFASDDGEVGPINVMGDNGEVSLGQSKPKKKALTKPTMGHHGFSSFSLIALVLIASVLVGVSVGYFIIK